MDNSYFRYDPACERMTAEEIENQQNVLLREQLTFCRDHSPYYGKLFRGMDFSSFTVKDLPSLPVTDKVTLASDPDAFLAVPMRDVEEIVFSSGTTGKPCKIMYSGRDMQRLAYNEHRCFAAAGMTPDDVVLLTCTLDRCFIAGLAYYLGARSIGASAVRNGLNSIESHAEMIRTLKPTILVGVPSFLRHLGLAMHEHGIDISRVRKLICIGEPVRDSSFRISGLGKQLEELWEADVHSTYGSSEIVTSFCECGALCGGHMLPDLVCTEILDENGNPVPDGQPGELTLTALQLTGMPLVRFRSGDITFKISEPCPCGRKSPRIGPILGRKAQQLKCKGTTLYPQVLYSVLDPAPEVAEYYMVVSGENLSDRIDVYAALKTPGASLKNLEERLSVACRMHIPVHEQDLDSVRLQVFGRSRKPVRFVDRRTGGKDA